MKGSWSNKLVLVLVAVCLLFGVISAQKSRISAKKPVSTTPQHLIFAIINDGKTLEPIAIIRAGKIEIATPGDTDAAELKSFAAKNYKPGTSYDVIFGGSPAGKVIVKSSDPAAECGKNLAEASLSRANSGLKGLVMALATDARTTKSQPSFRRRPTAEERAEIEKLVRAEFIEQGTPEAGVKNLRYQNLTALDVDHDSNPEFVGSYWTETDAKRRDLLFFIAEKDADGTYSLNYKDYSKVTPDDVMSGELNDVDGGRNHELLLDIFDYDGDGVSEIFTVNQGFEGNGFKVYKQNAGKWERVFEASNYHCAY